MRPRVLHVIQRVSRGGAGRSLAFVAESVSGFEHRVLSLDPGPGTDEIRRELAAADLVHVHFWNTPALYALLDGELPPMRLLLWPHVGGGSAPHAVTQQLVAYADATVASTPYTLHLPALPAMPVIPACGGWERVAGTRRIPHSGFNVGYIGTVDFAKMHPRYVAMSAAVEIPGVKFPVYGAGGALGALAEQAEALGVAERFELRGWVDDIRPALGSLDVFGYPLREDNYSASELVLQEAMYAGVPPVVLPYGGAPLSVDHRRTGLVAADEDDYARSIETLHRSEALREQLGRAAREHARRAWAPEAIAERWKDVYRRLLAKPKAERGAQLFGGLEGAALFARTLGDSAPQFERSLTASDTAEQLEAERAIVASSPALASPDAGGVLHYRRRYPDDAHLRHWSGLVLLGQGRSALAAGEFKAAMDLGFDHGRASIYLARAAA
jgi:glycosyltransferase involved in cell wall biosynthesis